jgi:hypothetical protein
MIGYYFPNNNEDNTLFLSLCLKGVTIDGKLKEITEDIDLDEVLHSKESFVLKDDFKVKSNYFVWKQNPKIRIYGHESGTVVKLKLPKDETASLEDCKILLEFGKKYFDRDTFDVFCLDNKDYPIYFG